MTWSLARSLCDSWASCSTYEWTVLLKNTFLMSAYLIRRNDLRIPNSNASRYSPNLVVRWRYCIMYWIVAGFVVALRHLWSRRGRCSRPFPVPVGIRPTTVSKHTVFPFIRRTTKTWLLRIICRHTRYSRQFLVISETNSRRNRKPVLCRGNV